MITYFGRVWKHFQDSFRVRQLLITMIFDGCQCPPLVRRWNGLVPLSKSIGKFKDVPEVTCNNLFMTSCRSETLSSTSPAILPRRWGGRPWFGLWRAATRMNYIVVYVIRFIVLISWNHVYLLINPASYWSIVVCSNKEYQQRDTLFEWLKFAHGTGSKISSSIGFIFFTLAQTCIHCHWLGSTLVRIWWCWSRMQSLPDKAGLLPSFFTNPVAHLFYSLINSLRRHHHTSWFKCVRLSFCWSAQWYLTDRSPATKKIRF